MELLIGSILSLVIPVLSGFLIDYLKSQRDLYKLKIEDDVITKAVLATTELARIGLKQGEKIDKEAVALNIVKKSGSQELANKSNLEYLIKAKVAQMVSK